MNRLSKAELLDVIYGKHYVFSGKIVILIQRNNIRCLFKISDYLEQNINKRMSDEILLVL